MSSHSPVTGSAVDSLALMAWIPPPTLMFATGILARASMAATEITFSAEAGDPVTYALVPLFPADSNNAALAREWLPPL